MKKCSKCNSISIVKSGVIKGRQRYKCKDCNYNFTVSKMGKKIDPYYVTKALQLFLEGLSFREIERIIGVSHVTISKLVRSHNIRRPIKTTNYYPTYQILTHSELVEYISDIKNLNESGLVINGLGDKFMLIKWERFRK